MATQGQITLQGAELALNIVSGAVTISVAGSAPSPANTSMIWVNGGVLYLWNEALSAWYSAANRYLALLTTSPATSGAGGGPAVSIGDLVEVTTPGYARAQVTIAAGADAVPYVVTNSGAVTWGPFTADMAVAAQWAALVTCASGLDGQLLYTWSGINEQVDASQSVEVPAGGLILNVGS